MTSAQLRMARAALRLGVREVAELAGVTPATVTRYETEKGGLNMKSIAAIQGALEAQGIRFLAIGVLASAPGVTFEVGLTPSQTSNED